MAQAGPRRTCLTRASTEGIYWRQTSIRCSRNTFPLATPIEKRHAFGMDPGLQCHLRGRWSRCRSFVLANARAGPVGTRRKPPDSVVSRSGPRTSGRRRPVGGRERCLRKIILYGRRNRLRVKFCANRDHFDEFHVNAGIEHRREKAKVRLLLLGASALPVLAG